ncbi:transposase [Myxococcota bacterium]|nr:transposase [Myxococcota bacterium]
MFGRAARRNLWQIASPFDAGYASNANLKAIKDKGVKHVCFHKKRGISIAEMTKSLWIFKRLRNFRAGIEGMISYLKRCVGLDRCTWKGLDHFKSYAWAAVVSANAVLLGRMLIC